MNFNTTPAKFIHDSFDLLSEIGNASQWIINTNRNLKQAVYNNNMAKVWVEKLTIIKRDAARILNLTLQNTNSCRDNENKLIDRYNVHKELLILATDIISIVNLAFGKLILEPRLDINVEHHKCLTSIREQCQILKSQAMEMIFESIKHDNENAVLTILAAKSDVNSPLNDIPGELINIFATIMFELKLNDAKLACGAT